MARGRTALRCRYAEWSPHGDAELDTVNHALRVVGHLGLAGEYRSDYLALLARRTGAGWRERGAHEIGTRNTAFAARNLWRAGEGFDSEVELAARNAYVWIADNQMESGFWTDRNWGTYDATSSGMGASLYARSRLDATAAAAARVGLDRSARAVVAVQEKDGSWGSDRADRVEKTAHLLPKLALHLGRRARPVQHGISYLVSCQAHSGAWNDDLDETCDATRALTLCTSLVAGLGGASGLIPLERAISWLMGAANCRWAPERTNTNLTHILDVVDTAVKLKHLLRSPAETIELWK